jgi:ferredoxin
MAEKVIKVWIVEGCVSCNACVTECPEVFETGDSACVVKGEATRAEYVAAYSDAVLTAAKACPTEVIKIEMGEAAAVVEAKPEVKKAEVVLEKPKAVAKPASTGEKPAAKKVVAKPAKKIVVYRPKIFKQEPGALGNPMGQVVKDGNLMDTVPANRAKAAAESAGVSGRAPADQIGTLLNVSGGYSRGIDLEKQIRTGVARKLLKAVFFPKHP